MRQEVRREINPVLLFRDCAHGYAHNEEEELHGGAKKVIHYSNYAQIMLNVHTSNSATISNG